MLSVHSVRVGEGRVGEVRVGEGRVGEVGVGEVRVGEVRVGEGRVGEEMVNLYVFVNQSEYELCPCQCCSFAANVCTWFTTGYTVKWSVSSKMVF